MSEENKTKRISTGYAPRFHQDILHRSLKRFNVLVCHRRFGKTVFSLNEMIDQALRCTKLNPHYAYIAPTYGQAKRVAWEYLKHFTSKIPGSRPIEGDLRLEIFRPATNDMITFWLLGAENPNSILGMYLDGVIIDEYADCDPIVWQQVVRPAISDRLGWVIFIGTVRGVNHFWKMYEVALEQMKADKSDWYGKIYKASETKILPQSELDAAKLTMGEDLYQQEFECDPSSALIGAYYGEQMRQLEAKGRVAEVPYDPAIPVDTYWDLGMSDTTCIWFSQQVGLEIHLIDYIEMSGKGVDYYVRELRNKPYTYREHYLPHDAAARELGTGKTRVETIRSLGLKPITVLPKWKIEDGIQAVRTLLPRCWFNRVTCDRGVLALKSYEKKWDERNQIFMDQPKHNWASNGADAFRYLAMGLIPDSRRQNINNLPRKAKTEYNLFGR